MRLGANDLTSLEWQTKLAVEDLEVQIQSGWNVEHRENGRHEDVTLDSITATDGIAVEYRSGRRDLQGPWLLDDPRLQGSAKHVAMLRPPDLAATTHHDYAPVGIDTAFGMEIEPLGNASLTGLKPYHPTLQKQFFYLRNRDSSFTLTLKHEDSGSTASWRFNLPGSVDVTIGPGQAFWLYYDPGRERWTATITGTQSGGLMPGTGVASVLDAQIEITIDGGGAVITTGQKYIYTRVPWNFTATSVEVVADASGSIVVDLWKDTYANFPPTNADSIVASAKPTLSSAQKSQDTTLSGWTTSWSEGDRIEAEVESCSTITKAIITVYGTRSS